MVTLRRFRSAEACFGQLMARWLVTAEEAAALWACVSAEARAQICGRLERDQQRKPWGPPGPDATVTLLETLDGHRLLEALDAAVAAGHVTRELANAVTEKVLQHMDHQGAWT